MYLTLVIVTQVLLMTMEVRETALGDLNHHGIDGGTPCGLLTALGR